MDKLQTLQTEIAEWSSKTFGEKRGPLPIIAHLKKEINELSDAVAKVENPRFVRSEDWDKASFEFADCFMLLLDAAEKFGMGTMLLMNKARVKLEINKARKWGEPDKDGVVEHIRKGDGVDHPPVGLV